MTKYLSTVEILAMHYVLIKRYGGSEGLRDPGTLDSALYRPKSGYYEDIIQEAAALWESLTKNHPFIDGNKRIGFAATDTFLRINGYRIKATSKEIWKMMDKLINSDNFEYESLEMWFRQNTEYIRK